MTTKEILKKVRRIEIKTRGLSNQIFSGEYHSAFKGRGMSFSEVREYMPGDDVRSIDWNVTARLSTPYVKVFEEERELTVMLLVDVSQSALLGTQSQSKRDVFTEIAAVLAFSAIKNNDKVGVLFFSDKIEKFIPPQKGRNHILRLIRELLTTEATGGGGTDIAVGLKYFNNASKRRTVAFLMSDFFSKPYEDELKLTARKHDLIGLRVVDPLDTRLPDVGMVLMSDSESGKNHWVDTGSLKTRKNYENTFRASDIYCQQVFKRNGAALISLGVEDDYVKALRGFFINR